MTFRGTLEGDILRGTHESAGGKHEWVARREPVSALGAWQVKGPSADTSGTLQVEKKHGICQATFTSGSSREPTPVPFYDWGGTIRFELPQSIRPVVFIGQCDGPRVTGSVTGGDLDKQQTFTAQRSTEGAE
jgi:hypothetical protein